MTSTTAAARSMQVIATAGHVDHGKSALLRALTAMEPDRWDEERRRGLTIDLGFVWTELPTNGASVTVAFVDVPGHDGFLPNMLCGVGVVDQVLFVVAGDDGWSAQSQEHLEILDLLQRRCVAAVVTKTDVAGPERTAAVVADVSERLVGTSLAGAPVLPVDSLHDEGIDALRRTIVERLATRPDASRDLAEERTRLWIDRVFSVHGAGTVVTGMLDAGRLQVDEDVEVAPQGHTVRVRGLQSLEQPVGSAAAPMRVAVNLSGLGPDQVTRGDALLARRAGSTRTAAATAAVDAQVEALRDATIGRRGAWHLHVGTAVMPVRLFPLLDDLDPGSRGPVRIEFDAALPVRAGDRFILRDAGRHRTAGGGAVLDPSPGPRRRGTERRLAHALTLEELAASTDVDDRVGLLVDAHGGLRRRDELTAIVGSALGAERVPPGLHHLGGHLVRPDRLEPWLAAVDAAATEGPPDQALAVTQLTTAATRAGCPADLAAAVIDHLVRDGALRRVGGRLVHPRHETTYLEARQQRQAAFLALLEADPLEPPDPGTAAERAAIPSFEVQALVDDGHVVACDGLLLVPAAITTAIERLRTGPGRDGAAFTASEARQAWDTNRRCAMPLLDHLRASGATTFDGATHRLTAAATGGDTAHT